MPEADLGAVVEEIREQFETFVRMTGRNPTHIGSHQHVHRKEPVRQILLEVGERLRVPVRHFSCIGYRGDFYGQDQLGAPHPEGISVERLVGLLATLPVGCTELACHPALSVDFDTMYRHERVQELRTLCDPRVRATIDQLGIALISFAT